jgi:hypothetical protein
MVYCNPCCFLFSGPSYLPEHSVHNLRNVFLSAASKTGALLERVTIHPKVLPVRKPIPTANGPSRGAKTDWDQEELYDRPCGDHTLSIQNWKMLGARRV